MNHVRSLVLSGIALAFVASAQPIAQAQDQQPQQRQRPGGGGGGGGGGRGNFDPEQMRQRMNERLREQFEVKDDEEWKVISERLTKVLEARREAGSGLAGMFGRGGGARRGPAGDGGTEAGGGGRARAFGGETLPEADALEKAIEAKASAEELKAKVAKLRDARKQKEAKLEAAQDELRKVLTVRQEATAVLNGYLK